MRTICHSLYIISILSPYYPLPDFPPALITYASFLDVTASTITPSFFPHLFLSRMLFHSHSLTLATHFRVGSGTRVCSYEHSSRGNHYVARERGFSFGLSSKWTMSVGKHEPRLSRNRFHQRPSGSRFAKSKSRSIGMDDTGRNSFLLAACGSRTWKG